MAQKRCGLGFDCAAMMMRPGLDPADCANYKTCGGAQQYTDEDLIELVRIREEGWERIRITRQEAAIMMLMQRGCPQTCESLEVTQLVDEIEAALRVVKRQLRQFEDVYIAPERTELHEYNVKRRGKTFWYNKLSSSEAIFEPSERSQKVKTVHVSHSDDPRCLEAEAGIRRRNRLTQSRSRLRDIQSLLAEIQEFLDVD